MTWKKILRRPLLILLLAIAIAGLSYAGWAWRDLRRQRAHYAAAHLVNIPTGASTASVISLLHTEGIVAHEMPALLWMQFVARGRSFKAGDYLFKSPISTIAALEKVLRGDVETRHVTIPEGYNKFDIARTLSSLTGFKDDATSTFENTLEMLNDSSAIADLDPHAKSLEGYLFPDTYEYMATTTRRQIIENMVRRFRHIWTPEKQDRAKELRMSTRQVVTLASLIEEEAKVDSERELISSVFHRRLKLKMPLACDPTVIYAALIEGKYRGKIFQSDLERNSPYNTYRRPGLPPSPIASPGKRSLEAALNPADTDYLYFVVDATTQNGAHKFSASSADHDRAVAALREAERK
jgi:UPF0755 protein